MYYARWLGTDEDPFGAERTDFRYSAERDRVQPGYGQRFDVWALVTGEQTLVSYGAAARDRIGALRETVPDRCDAAGLAAALRRVYGTEPAHGVKYVFRRCDADPGGARPLGEADYPAYERFFRDCHPDAETKGWLREYFSEMAAEGLCCGVFADGRLVSCTDAPTVPYLEDRVREIGIHTLPAYRRRGFAAQACARCISEILKAGRCPIWSTDAGNAASRALAARAGFGPFADCLSLTLPQKEA